MRPASWNQSQITDASHLLVFARRATMTTADVDAYVNRMVEVRGGDAAALADYRKMMLGHVTNPALDVTAWATKQVYIALGVFLAAAAMMGVDSCPMEGFLPAEYDRILKLPEQGFHVVKAVHGPTSAGVARPAARSAGSSLRTSMSWTVSPPIRKARSR